MENKLNTSDAYSSMPSSYSQEIGTDKNYIAKYTKSVRNTNLAVMKLFTDIVTFNDNEEEQRVPIVPGTAEKAAIYAFGEQFFKNPDRVEEGLVKPKKK